MLKSLLAWCFGFVLVLSKGLVLAAAALASSSKSSLSKAQSSAGGQSTEHVLATNQRVPPPQQVNGDWWASVQKELAASEYHATSSDKATLPDVDAPYQAANRAQNLRTYFGPDGVYLVSRSEAVPTWSVSLGVRAMGRSKVAKPVGSAQIVTNANRIDYVRPGMTEWYSNCERGLEQGFVMVAPPAGEGDLLLRLAAGKTTPRFASDGVAEFFTSQGARVLRHAELKAFAKDGCVLASAMAVNHRTVELRVTAADGDYPVTIDPLATNPDWTAERDQADADLGRSVAPAGDVNGDGFADIRIGALNIFQDGFA